MGQIARDFSEILEEIDEVEPSQKTLLLGNGFSCAINPDFSYPSLFELAKEAGLESSAVQLFEHFGVSNFEAVMRLLEDSDWIASHYDLITDEQSSPMVRDLNSVKCSLIKAIEQAHPRHTFLLSEEQKNSCQKFLSYFHDIYTLNYDLLLYWTLQGSKQKRIDEFGFPLNDYEEPEYLVMTQRSSQDPRLYHLHGALHLYTVEGETRKRRLQYQRGLIMDMIIEGIQNSQYPLFVAEGSSKKKLLQIRTSDYLSHCFWQFKKNQGILLSYGVSFGDSDNHISDAIAENSNIQRLIVGIYGDEESELNLKVRASLKSLQVNRKTKHSSRPLDVTFFQAETANVWTNFTAES